MTLLNLRTHSGVVSGRCLISRLIPLFFQTLSDCKTEVFDTGNVVHKASLIEGFQNSGILANFYVKNFDYPEKPLKYKHIRRISD